ncbi:hypothetical protein J3458_015176 [Metarhizium acridum]|uniref:uncharacterized protein n=1 Tax=Metarhizium acridum TaxID=92637 RepID=UPI001C6AC170|nr:hypothetical protein J3458_015176 [Metarhizium acridum]
MERFRSQLSFRNQRLSSGNARNHEAQAAIVDYKPSGGQAGSRPSSCNAPDQPFPDGVEALHDCHDALVDICLAHGLTGNRNSTWTAGRQLAPWPQTLLPLKLGKARIITYGYDAYLCVDRSHLKTG